MAHICVAKLSHWCRQWLVACSAPSHYLNQCWHTVNWTLANEFQWNFIWNSRKCIWNSLCKMAAILSLPECVNSSPPSAAYMRQWTGSALVEIIPVVYSAPNHYLNMLNQCWNIVNLTLRNKLQWNINQNTEVFIHKNTFENVVCKMAAILFRVRWVNEAKPLGPLPDGMLPASRGVVLLRTSRGFYS